jgi:hypothetical protein
MWRTGWAVQQCVRELRNFFIACSRAACFTTDMLLAVKKDAGDARPLPIKRKGAQK